MIEHIKEIPEKEQALGLKIRKALDVAYRYGTIGEAQHKAWVIDQMVRCLLEDEYEEWVIEVRKGIHGPNTYRWYIGIAP